MDEERPETMTEMYQDQAQPSTDPSAEGGTLESYAGGYDPAYGPAAGGPAMVNEISAIGHDLSSEEGIAAANAAISNNLGQMGQKISELRRIIDARARMNMAYKQLHKATARGAPLDQVVPMLKDLEELKDSGIPVSYGADQVQDMLSRAEEARIIIDEYLRILTAMEQHECCQKPAEATL